jgi:hypothetical protein
MNRHYENKPVAMGPREDSIIADSIGLNMT